jgi:hypothetical protein
MLRNTVATPLVVLQQAGDRFLYLTDQAAVVIRRDGQIVTTWTEREFWAPVRDLLRAMGGR